MTQNRPLELPQRRRGLDPELLTERAPAFAVDGERVGLAPAPVERDHQLASQPLAERMIRDQLAKLTDEVAVTTEGEVGVDPIPEGGEPKLH